MPSHRQLLTTPQAKGGTASIGLGINALGSSDYSALRALYPGSPAYDGSYGDEEVVLKYIEVNQSPVSDGGVTFGTVDRDYGLAPDLSTVPTGGGGLPISPFAPNPASPGPGLNAVNIPNVDPSKVPQGGGGFGNGSGLVSPSETSRVISRQKMGNLQFGRSTPRG